MVKRRQLRMLGATLLLFAALPLAGPATGANAAGLSGQWNVLSVVDCKPNAANAAFCGALFSGIPYITRFITSLQALCDPNGVCSFQEAIVFTGSSPSGSCAVILASTPFKGQCTYTFTGKAHIAQDIYKVPGFIEDSATGTWSGASGVTLPVNPATLPYDLGVPALPGVYPNTSLNLQLLGLLPPNASAPPGVTFNAVIQQDTSATTVKPVALALPLPLDTSGPGTSAGFIVGWFSSVPGQGNVEFGSGPGCGGLVETGTQDQVQNQTMHVVVVTGNDLPGAIGDSGLLAGSTYQFQTVSASRSGQEVDNNGGKCYGVAIPKT